MTKRYRIGSHCPVCTATLGNLVEAAATRDGTERAPKPGDLSTCTECTSILRMGEMDESGMMPLEWVVSPVTEIENRGLRNAIQEHTWQMRSARWPRLISELRGLVPHLPEINPNAYYKADS